MKRYMAGVGAFLLAGMLVSCGGGGGDRTGAGGSGGGPAADAGRVEESASAVSLSGTWTPANPGFGWSGGNAVQATAAGAKASLTFSGNSVTWYGARGQGMGIALVSVDGGPAREVNLFAHPYDEIRSPAFTVNGLSDGTHTLTIEVSGRADTQAQGTNVVVDAFDVQGQIVSHLQDTNLDQITYTGGWTDAANQFLWSGGGVANGSEPTRTAHVASAAGETATLRFRGTSVSWIGYRGPDAGIATVSIDGGAATEVDTYSASTKVQDVLFASGGLADGDHTLTITATDRRNAASTGAQVFIDAFNVTSPGRRFQEWEPSIAYSGSWTPRNDARVWSEGTCATSFVPGSRATFSFTGTGVSWISSAKDSLGRANVYIDGVLQREVVLYRPFPTESYQYEIFRIDGLAPGAHTITVEVVDSGGGYVVVDAFDVR
ncbi:MAG TPA: hypothetical protein VGJ74_14125 [Burkholderiales bacterium]|jgi:hypothetical protein